MFDGISSLSRSCPSGEDAVSAQGRAMRPRSVNIANRIAAVLRFGVTRGGYVVLLFLTDRLVEVGDGVGIEQVVSAEADTALLSDGGDDHQGSE